MSSDGAMQAAYNPMIQGGMGGGMADAGKQMWLCGWLPVLDFKSPLTPIAEMCPFFTKQVLPGAGAVKLLPTMPQGFLAKLLSQVFSGFQLENWAADLSPEQIEAIMHARASGIAAPDGSASISLQALGALSNVAMNRAAMMGDDGHGIG